VAGEAALLALLAGDLGGNGVTGPLICLLIAALAVWALLAARRRAPDDPPGGRAYLVLGCGLAFAALSSTALVLALFSDF
jgi:hypothetical protein